MDEKYDRSNLEKDFPAIHSFLQSNSAAHGDLDNFLNKVEEIGSIIKDLSASDKAVSKEALAKADRYFQKTEEERKLKEQIEGKVKYSRTVLNKSCLKDSHISQGDDTCSSMSREAFMTLMERDAAARAARRAQKESEK